MSKIDYAHWVQANGEPYTKETMRAEAIERFTILLKKDTDARNHPQDGSKGQASAWNQTLIESLTD